MSRLSNGVSVAYEPNGGGVSEKLSVDSKKSAAV